MPLAKSMSHLPKDSQKKGCGCMKATQRRNRPKLLEELHLSTHLQVQMVQTNEKAEHCVPIFLTPPAISVGSSSLELEGGRGRRHHGKRAIREPPHKGREERESPAAAAATAAATTRLEKLLRLLLKQELSRGGEHRSSGSREERRGGRALNNIV